MSETGTRKGGPRGRGRNRGGGRAGAAGGRAARAGPGAPGNPPVGRPKRFTAAPPGVRGGFECGIGLGSFNDIKIDDVIETFELREKPRK